MDSNLFEWHEPKRLANLKNHHIDFEDAKRIFAGPCLERPDRRRDYGEERWISVGVVEGYEIVVVYTWRGKKRRLISARRAHERERKEYRRALLERAGS